MPSCLAVCRSLHTHPSRGTAPFISSHLPKIQRLGNNGRVDPSNQKFTRIGILFGSHHTPDRLALGIVPLHSTMCTGITISSNFSFVHLYHFSLGFLEFVWKIILGGRGVSGIRPFSGCMELVSLRSILLEQRWRTTCSCSDTRSDVTVGMMIIFS